MTTLDKTVQFRASADEKGHLAQAAEDAGMKLSPYLRSVVLARTVVVVGGSVGVVIIPATDSPTALDEQIEAAVEAAIKRLNGQAQSPAPASAGAAVVPAAEPPPAVATAAGPAPGSAPPTSPGEGGGMVGSSPSQGPPSPPIAAAVPLPAPQGEAGAIPGPGETLSDDVLEPGGPDACPHCGGTEGRHQSFCEQVRGEPPVTGTETPREPPQPEGRPIETRDQFIGRRTGEGESQIVAEAEWRQITSSGQAPAAQTAACPNCGTLKSTAAACPDCGAPPQ